MPNSYISKITTSQGTFYLKDSEARDLIAAISGQIQFKLAVSAATTPLGVTWDNNGTLVTGTLVPATNTGTSSTPVWSPTAGYYLVPQTNASGKDYFEEYVVVNKLSGGSYGGYAWEKLGDTEIDFSSLGALAYKDSVTLNKQTATVLASGAQGISSGVTVDHIHSTTDTFVKSYPGTTQVLETTSITGTNGTQSVSKVTKTSKTSTNTVFGTPTTASLVTTSSKTATNTVLGTATTASKATAGTAISVPQKNWTASPFSRITLSSGNTSILEKATVDASTETLTLSTASVTQGSVTGVGDTYDDVSITPYTFADVSVPVISSNSEVTFNAVASTTDVSVPVVSSNTEVSTDAVTITDYNVAKVASAPTVVATGQTVASDTNGDSVLTGLGTANTATAVTDMGTFATRPFTITINGPQDKLVDVLTDDTSITVA